VLQLLRILLCAKVVNFQLTRHISKFILLCLLLFVNFVESCYRIWQWLFQVICYVHCCDIVEVKYPLILFLLFLVRLVLRVTKLPATPILGNMKYVSEGFRVSPLICSLFEVIQRFIGDIVAS
jgi:hypothetical protein